MSDRAIINAERSLRGSGVWNRHQLYIFTVQISPSIETLRHLKINKPHLRSIKRMKAWRLPACFRGARSAAPDEGILEDSHGSVIKEGLPTDLVTSFYKPPPLVAAYSISSIIADTAADLQPTSDAAATAVITPAPEAISASVQKPALDKELLSASLAVDTKLLDTPLLTDSAICNNNNNINSDIELMPSTAYTESSDSLPAFYFSQSDTAEVSQPQLQTTPRPHRRRSHYHFVADSNTTASQKSAVPYDPLSDALPVVPRISSAISISANDDCDAAAATEEIITINACVQDLPLNESPATGAARRDAKISTGGICNNHESQESLTQARVLPLSDSFTAVSAAPSDSQAQARLRPLGDGTQDLLPPTILLPGLVQSMSAPSASSGYESRTAADTV